ncbi:MAG: Ig-like domain-containing protein, partial [bacterium]|nr:Ig-like domain-containing protein [bacterium]
MLWGLDNDTSYRVRVRAVSRVGSSPGMSVRSAWAVSGPESPTVEFAVADVSGVRLVRGGGNRVYRTVHLVHADDPRRDFAGRPMGVMIHAGPSKGRPVDCVSGAVVPVGLVEGGPLFESCETDGEGMLRLSYVPSVVVGNDEVGKDFFSLYADLDEDGVYDAGESPLVPIPGNVQVARRINLVALGDSYSAGQQGNLGDITDAGTRLNDKCSRWDVAYPYLLRGSRGYAADKWESFACSGAITLNIHDPSGNSETNRPAPSLVVGDEPRQAVGLATVRGRLYGESPSRSVDMVTLTIGGNDLGFAAVFKACYLLGCGLDGQAIGTAKLEVDLPKVLAEVKRKTSHRRHPNRAIMELIAEPPSAHAAIFLLGYPNLLPPLSRDLDDCRAWKIERVLESTDVGSTDLGVIVDQTLATLKGLRFVVYAAGGGAGRALTAADFLAEFGEDNTTAGVVVDVVATVGVGIAVGLITAPLVGPVGAAVLGIAAAGVLAKDFAEAKARISGDEHRFLLATAQALNGVLRDAAWDAGVHFVSVAEEFDGHYVCGHPDDPGAPWVHGLVGTGEAEVSGATLHPNRAGHRATASILHDFVAQVTERALNRGAVLNRAGVPVAPVVSRPPRSGVVGAAEGSRAAGAAGQGPADGRAVEAPPPVSDRVLLARAVAPSVCGWLAPGDVVELVASGFAAGSVVGFAVAGASVLDPAASPLRVVEGLSIPAATADAEGRVSVHWTVPQAPPAATDPLPRWYVIKATGTGADGEASVLYVARPLVAYPAAAPCAADDAASTTLGRAVRVAVLANDTAPAGGSLDRSSVWVQKATGGVFSVDGASGAVTFTPDAGFAGTVATHYWVYDGWGLGVRGALSVTVDAGCTITAAGGAVEVVGTEGDDVICVAAPEDPTALHVIDARGGDDVILAGAGVDRIDAGEGDDVVYGRGGDDVIAGGPGFDAIHGGDGFDTVYSTDLVDRIVDDAGGYELILAAPAPAARGAPTPGDDAAHVAAGGAVLVDVLGNDYDSGGNLLAASLRITRAPAQGAAAVVGDSVGEIGVLYTAGDAAGVDTFTYEVCDTLNACATAEVTVTVGTARCTIVGTEG